MVMSSQIRGVMGQALKHSAVSVVMPLYNKEHEVTRAIKSVLSQTFTDFELIVINDGSTDEGPDIVRSFNDSRIKVVDQPNAGVSAARNKGITEASADLIAFLDADDEWEPDFLETIIRLRDKFASCAVFATNYFFCRSKEYRRPTIIRGLPPGFKEGILTDYFVIAARSDPPLWSSAVAVEKKAIEIVGGFPVGVVAGEDLLTWARLAAKYDIAFSIEPKAYHWEPVELSDRPGRVPNRPDIVGEELELLLRTCTAHKSKGLNDYVALWHRMRASIYIRLGRRWSALKEIQKAAYFSGVNLKLFAYSILAVLPKRLFINLLKFRHHSFS
jgi:glycosyltransferase involved in cell wall biosynthesis